jgi:hypothetical protein
MILKTRVGRAAGGVQSFGGQTEALKCVGAMPTRTGILSLVARGTGQVRSFHVASTRGADLVPIIKANIARRGMTDEAGQYTKLGKYFAKHEAVDHGREEWGYRDVNTNTVEGYYSIFKRGMKGIYQHCSEKHLHRYVAEFDVRDSNRVALGVNDRARTERTLRVIVGRRLTCRDS